MRDHKNLGLKSIHKHTIRRPIASALPLFSLSEGFQPLRQEPPRGGNNGSLTDSTVCGFFAEFLAMAPSTLLFPPIAHRWLTANKRRSRMNGSKIRKITPKR
ncbi:hypothetical protein LZ32DRAFT_202233 [Colletotrichum eremochloae]|nr:hypothetical protein LZ32DRAFT_202233 [Colletotrichum eremochloae]